MNINLLHSKNVIEDFDKLSDGRKAYISKRAGKKSLSVPDYLKQKYEA